MRYAVTAVAMCMFLMVSGCKDDHESLIKDSIGKMNDLTAALKSVKDKDSSKAAAPKVKAIGEDMAAIKKKMDALGKPAADEDKKLEAKYKSQLEEALKGFMGEAMRIGMNPALMTPELEAAMSGLDKQMK